MRRLWDNIRTMRARKSRTNSLTRKRLLRVSYSYPQDVWQRMVDKCSEEQYAGI